MQFREKSCWWLTGNNPIFAVLKDWDKAEHIPDPDAEKPEDWDDEVDGEWEPPMIDNPDYKVIDCPLVCFL